MADQDDNRIDAAMLKETLHLSGQVGI